MSTPPSDLPKMEYRFLGRSGLQISEISIGGWLTYGGHVEDGMFAFLALDFLHMFFFCLTCSVTFGYVVKFDVAGTMQTLRVRLSNFTHTRQATPICNGGESYRVFA